MSKHPQKPNLSRRNHLKTSAKLLGFVLLLGEVDIAWGAKILGVRIWPSEDYTRVTLESDTPLPITQQILTNPDRLVVDVQGSTASARMAGSWTTWPNGVYESACEFTL